MHGVTYLRMYMIGSGNSVLFGSIQFKPDETQQNIYPNANEDA
jgi:diphthamide biosynthesis methyltransferase